MQEIIFLPNKIFADFQAKFSSSKNIAFAYSYYYYICYLYRYCKYVVGNNERITQQDIKSFLGYAQTNKSVDFIIKKGGALDDIGYTASTTDYPLQWEFFNDTQALHFYRISDLKEISVYGHLMNDRNFKIKFPIKAFHKSEEDHYNGLYNGTFYEVQNTHGITFDVYTAFMQNPNLGLISFYLYGYLKSKCAIFQNGYQASQFVLEAQTKISLATIKKCVRMLEKENYIEIEHKPFNMGSTEYEANIYHIPENQV